MNRWEERIEKRSLQRGSIFELGKRHFLLKSVPLITLLFSSVGDGKELSEKESAWFLSTETPREGKSFKAWLYLTQADSEWVTEIEIISGEFLSAQWDSLPNSKTEHPSSILLLSTGKSFRQVFSASVTAADDQPSILLAILRRKDANGIVEKEQAVSSLQIRPSNFWALRDFPAGVAIASLSFLLGLASTFFQAFFSEFRKSRRWKIELKKSIIDALKNEVSENLKRLRNFVNQQAVAQELEVAGYNSILGDNGLTGFLDEGTRRAWWKKTVKSYDLIRSYNRDIREGQKTEDQLRNTARELLKRISKEET